MKIKMTSLIKIEELAQFLLSIILFNQLDYAWWVFPTCILLPDLSMIGYLGGNKSGALFYNFFHHKFIAITVFIIGLYMHQSTISLAGLILFGHSSMDRMFGYGLKFDDDFKHTHLGWIGKSSKR